MALKIAVMNQKGGVAKTTTVQMITDYFRTKGRVLVVDLDQQDNQKQLYKIRNTDHARSMAGVLIKDVEPTEAVFEVRENVDLITSGGARLEKFPERFKGMSDDIKNYALAKAFKNIEENYDYIIFDTNPSFTLTHLNVVFYVDHVVFPSNMDILALASTQSAIRFVQAVAEDKVLGIIPTMVYERRNNDMLLLDQYEQILNSGLLGEKTKLFSSIKESSKIKTSQTRRKFLSETFPEDEITKIGMDVCAQIEEAISELQDGSEQMNLNYNQDLASMKKAATENVMQQ